MNMFGSPSVGQVSQENSNTLMARKAGANTASTRKALGDRAVNEKLEQQEESLKNLHVKPSEPVVQENLTPQHFCSSQDDPDFYDKFVKSSGTYFKSYFQDLLSAFNGYSDNDDILTPRILSPKVSSWSVDLPEIISEFDFGDMEIPMPALHFNDFAE